MCKRLRNIGSLYKSQRIYDEAKIKFNESMDLAEKIKDKEEIALSCNSLGVLYNTLGNKKKSIALYNKGLKLGDDIGNILLIALCLGNIGMHYYDDGNYNLSIKYLKRSYLFNRKLGELDSIAMSLKKMGSCFIKLREFKKAFLALRLAKKYFLLILDDHPMYGQELKETEDSIRIIKGLLEGKIKEKDIEFKPKKSLPSMFHPAAIMEELMNQGKLEKSWNSFMKEMIKEGKVAFIDEPLTTDSFEEAMNSLGEYKDRKKKSKKQKK